MKFIKQATKDSRSKGKKIDCLETLRLEKNQWWFPVGSVCLSLFFALHIIAWALKSPVTWKEQWAKREKLPEKAHLLQHKYQEKGQKTFDHSFPI